MLGIQSNKSRTAIFSGSSKAKKNQSVLRLEDACLNCLKDHHMYITYLGNTPYYLIKPVLEKCNPDMLFRIEDYNPQLIGEDDELWKVHCSMEFKTKRPMEDESWRELYIRLKYERELKLKSITAYINRKSAKATPIRKTKLAFVEAAPKGQRGTKRTTDTVSSTSNSYSSGSGRGSTSTSGSLGSHGGPRSAKEAIMGSRSAAAAPPAAKKTKVAPLMRKSIEMMKSRFRR